MSEEQAGRELDAAIARRIFGLVVYEGMCFDPDAPDVVVDLPPFSTDLTTAWKVMEAVTDPKWVVNNTPSQWVRDVPPSRHMSYWWDRSHLWSCTAEQVASQICRAALAFCTEDPGS